MDKIKMGIGFGGWRLGTPSAATIFELIDKADAWGIDSIWLSDHIIDVGVHPELDTPTMLAAIAARTTRLKMGPSVLLLPLRHPVVAAKTFATLDYLAPGRVICAVGLGANPKEFGAMGMTIEHRAGKLDEGMLLMRKLWSESHVTFAGKYYQVEDVTIEPKPARGYIDLWVGGRTEYALKRVARLGDGWFASRVTPQQYREGRQQIAEFAREYGRDAADIEAGAIVFCNVSDRSQDAHAMADRFFQNMADREHVQQHWPIGSPQECCEKLARYVEAGLTKFVLWPACPPSDLIAQIDRFAHQLIPEFCTV
ncbi:MAG: LLM class flavin-dependent oxidoreductase [Deltaproteobacteria bacterium]|nr:LLM class flavin-dependent oxidoreductase [Deltaproteobacteria bacterium]